MSCLDEQTMLDFLAGALSREARQQALKHLDGCDLCRAVLASLARERRDPAEPATTPVPALFQPERELPRLGQFRLDEKLREGGMAEVFLATQLGPGGFERRCVVKLPLETGDEHRSLFLAEAKVLASVDHPNVARVLALGEDEGRLFLAMERIEGRSIKELLAEFRRERGRVPLAAALEVVRQAALGLGAAHDAGAIHRDVAPGNLMLARSGVVKVIDFGLARSPHGERTAAGIIKGTPRYFSPEQARGGKLDARTDVFSLGLVLYEVLTSEQAYDEQSVPALMKRAGRGDVPRQRPAWVPADVWKLYLGCTQLEPEGRFPSMAALVEAIADVAPGGGAGEIAALAARSAKALSVGARTQPIR